MRSAIAEETRRIHRAGRPGSTPSELLDEALRLGEAMLEDTARFQNISIEETRRRIQRRRQAGRRYSKVATEIIG
jgi:hypothetical protein